jgi:hypothetical protein
VLLEATLVADLERPDPAVLGVGALLVEATPVQRKQQVLMIAGIVLLSSTVVALAVGVPLGLRGTGSSNGNGGNSSSSSSNNEGSTESPTSDNPAPSFEPTRRPVPTFVPASVEPTRREDPAFIPTASPYPQLHSTRAPRFSAAPGESFDRKRFQQPFGLNASSTEAALLTEEQTLHAGQMFASYTPRFALGNSTVQAVSSLCLVASQSISQVENSTTFINAIDYTCQYASASVSVTGYPDLFLTYVNGNLTGVTNDLVRLGLPVLRSDEARAIEVFSLSPTISVSPSSSWSPTQSPRPEQHSSTPGVPSVSPTQAFSLPVLPSPPPSPSSGGPQAAGGLSVPAIFGIAGVLAVAMIVLPIVHYLARRRQYRSPRRGPRRV